MTDAMMRRLTAIGALLAVAALALPFGAPAGTGVLAGPTEALLGDGCGIATSKVFAKWGDPGLYYLVPGGDVETKRHGWTFADSASVVASKSLLGTGSRAVGLGAGGRATTQPFCVTHDSPTTRFVVNAPKDPLARLRVDVVAPCLLGTCVTPIGWVAGGSPGLRPSQPMLLLANLTSVLSSNGRVSLQLRFTAEIGSWTVDDVYVDPFRRV